MFFLRSKTLENRNADIAQWDLFMHVSILKSVNPKGNQPWIFIARTDAEAEAPIFLPCDAKSQLTGKDPDAGKDWGKEEKSVTEDEIVGYMNLSKLLESGKDRKAWFAAVHVVLKSQTKLSNWTIAILPQTPLPYRLPPNIEKHPCLNSRTLLVIHFKYSTVYMFIPNSVTIPPTLACLLYSPATLLSLDLLHGSLDLQVLIFQETR